MGGVRFLSFLVVAFVVAGCLDEPGPDSDRVSDALPSDVVSMEAFTTLSLKASLPATLLNDIAFLPGFVYASAHTGGTRIFNVSDPTQPVEVAMVPCTGIDVGITELPDGRRIMSISHSGGDGCPNTNPEGGIRLVDVTDPEEPKILEQVKVPGGSHSHSVYGTTGLIYNSQAAQKLPGGGLAIVNITDPEDPEVTVFQFPATTTWWGCHDIFLEPSRQRAICSGASETSIWDLKDPHAPGIISRIINPRMQVHHWAATTLNGTLLVLGDESGGFIGPACTPPAPIGALWAYDIRDATNPVEKGFFVPPRGLGPALCTAHYFNFIDDGPLLVGGFYTSGSVLVDFTEPSSPKLLDQEIPAGANVWSTYWNQYDGYVYVGDWGRGLDVFKLG